MNMNLPTMSFMDTQTGSTIGGDHDYLFKILMIGDSAVGKTSLIERFAEDSFRSNFVSTIGVDFKIFTMKYQDKIIKFQIWDTAGQERFRSITQTYYRGAHGVVMVYDVSDLSSLQNIYDVWTKEVEKYARPDASLLMIGNKTDLGDQTSNYLNQDQSIPCIKTSAKNGEGVMHAFCRLADQLIEQQRNRVTCDIAPQYVQLTAGQQITKSFMECCKMM
mmetsp:Transcript_29498/g.50943  ORF Transcript_29498/g.50943 Transcript_29498/m.50943 type:complete len:219 (-) Transcript_29498:233-889(-)